MIKYFENEEDAHKQAIDEARSILSNRAYINPDKFSNILTEYRRRQRELDAEIALNIDNQVDNMKQAKEVVDECDTNVDKIKEHYASLSTFWTQDDQFHKDMEIFDKVFTIKRNISTVLDQLNDFMNMSSQLKELEEFHDEPANFEYIQNQITFLKDLRENMTEKVGGEQGKSTQLLQTMIKRFAVLDNFEDKFYTNIYKIVGDCIEYAKKAPHVLVKALRLVEAADKRLIDKGRPPYHYEKCREIIVQSIENRFETNLKDNKEIEEIQKQIGFTVSDLVDVYDYVIPCFPPKYDIWKIYQESYKLNVEKIIQPFLEKEDEIKESFGMLIIFATWLDNYEGLLKRAGVSDAGSDYALIRARIKNYMPFFIEHIEELLRDWTYNIMKQDQERYSPEHLASLDKNNDELVTNFPQDLFTLINNQLAILGDQIQGELYIEVLRTWVSGLVEFQRKEKLKLLAGLMEGDLLKVVVYINNYYKCISFAHGMEDLSKKYANKEYYDRIEHIMADIPHAFNDSINEMLRAAGKLSLVDIQRDIVYLIFKPEWLEEQFIMQSMVTLEDYFSDFKKWFLSPLHYSRVVRASLELLVELYIDRFIYAAKKKYNTTLLKGFEPKIMDMHYYNEKKKQVSRAATDVFVNKDRLIATMTKDLETIMSVIQEKYANVVPKTSIEKITKSFTLIFNLLTIAKFDFEEYLHKIYETFGENGKYVLESCVAIRDDCESSFRKQIVGIFVQHISKEQPPE